MLDWILIIIIFVSLGIVVKVIVNKLPGLSSVDVEQIFSVKNTQTKKNIAARKLERKMDESLGGLGSICKWCGNFCKSKLKICYNRLCKLDKEYSKINQKNQSNHDADGQVFDRIKSAIHQNKYHEAEEELLGILEFDQSNAQAYELLGEMYFQQKDYKHSREIYRHLIKLDKEKHKHYQSPVQKNVKRAEKDYLRSLNVSRNIVGHYVNLALIAKATENWQEATQVIGEAVKIEPNNPKYLDLLVEVSIINENKNLAQKALDRLRKINPTNKKLKFFQRQIIESGD